MTPVEIIGVILAAMAGGGLVAQFSKRGKDAELKNSKKRLVSELDAAEEHLQKAKQAATAETQ